MRRFILNACLGLGVLLLAQQSFAQAPKKTCEELLGPAGTRLMPSALTAEHFVCILKGISGEAAPPEFQDVPKFDLAAGVTEAAAASTTSPTPPGITYADGKLTWTVVVNKDATAEIKTKTEAAMATYFKRAMEAADRLEQANLTALLASASFKAVLPPSPVDKPDVVKPKEPVVEPVVDPLVPEQAYVSGCGTTCCGGGSACCATRFGSRIFRFLARFRRGGCGTVCVSRPVSCGSCASCVAAVQSPLVLAPPQQEPEMKPEATVHFAVANLPQVEVQPAVEVPSAAVESKPEVTVVASAPVVKAAPSSAVKSQATVQSASLVAMPVVMMPVAPRSAYLFSDAEVLRLLAMSAGRSEIAERELVLGRKHWSAGNYQGAMVRFTEAVRSNPESTLAWSYRAICLLNMGDELAAAQAIDQAARLIEKYPSDRSMLYQSLARVQGGARLRFESLLRLSSVERSRQASASPSFAGR